MLEITHPNTSSALTDLPQSGTYQFHITLLGLQARDGLVMPLLLNKRLIKQLDAQMRAAAEALEFEKAALLRDQIYELRHIMADKEDLPPWKRAHALAGES
jgi:hypothetical protein